MYSQYNNNMVKKKKTKKARKREVKVVKELSRRE
jgi:hypothetical protein